MAVSVVMPNFNNAKFVEQWIGPLVHDPAVSEILIYDNGSTDGSPEMLEALGAGKTKVIRGERNVGATLARHAAIEAAFNDLICYLDGDDFLGELAVTKALEALRRDDLDIALFQCLDVDEDGSNPRVHTPTPDHAMDGRTAAALTLGGWHIHAWGLVKKALYLKAWENFHVHGFLSDEVHTRKMLLMARRVGPSEGVFYYRRVPKTYPPQKTVDWGRTTVRALALGVDSKLDRRAVRMQGRQTVRFLFGLTRRAWRGAMPRDRVAGLLDEYFRIRTPWTAADLPWVTVDRLLRLTRPSLGPAPVHEFADVGR